MTGGNGNDIIYRKLNEIEDKLFSFILETRRKFKNFLKISIESTTTEKNCIFYAEGEVTMSFGDCIAPFKIKMDELEEKIISAAQSINYQTESGRHILKVSAIGDPAYNGEGAKPLLPYNANILLAGNIETMI